jgi:hypothetical protein
MASTGALDKVTAFHKKATTRGSLPLAVLGIISPVSRTGYSPDTQRFERDRERLETAYRIPKDSETLR